MPRYRLAAWPHFTAPLIGLLALSGSLIFTWYLLFELKPSAASRWALGLQLGAALLAALFARWQPPRRLIIYPALLAVVIYLWDHTLPPISLPDGPVRWLVPRLVLLGVLADLLGVLRRRLSAPDFPRGVNGQTALSAPREPTRPGGVDPDSPLESQYVSGFDDGYQGYPRLARTTPAYRRGWQAGRVQYREQHGRDPARPSGAGHWLVVLLLTPLCAAAILWLDLASEAAWLPVLLRLLSGGP